MASQLSSKTNVAAQLADAVRERGSATRQWAVSWVTRTAGMTEKSAEKVVNDAVAKSLLIEREGALMPRLSSNPSSAPPLTHRRGTTVATAKKASKKASARKPASKKTELTAEQKAAVEEGKALLKSIQGGGTFTEPALVSKPRSAKKPSAKKPPSAKKASKKASTKKASAKKPSAKKPSAKPAPAKAPSVKKPSAKKASSKKPSAKPAPAKAPSAKKPSAKKASSKKPSAKKPSAKKPSVKRASKKTASKKAASKKKASAKKPSAKKAASKKPSAKRASKKTASKKASRKTAKRASAKKTARKSAKKRPVKRASAKKASARKASRKPRAAKRASAKKASSRKPKTKAAKKASAKKRAAAKKSTSRKSAKRSSTKAAKEKKMSKSKKAQNAAVASKPKAKRRSAKARLVSSLKSAEHAASKLSNKPHKPRAQKKPAKPAKSVPVGRYTNSKGAQIVIHRTYARSNPAMGMVDLAAVGGGLLVGIIAADVTDRLVATRAPKGAEAALNGVAAKDALQRPADGVRLLVQGGATGVFGLAAFLLRDRVPTAAAGVAGLAVGFGANFIQKLVADVVMPKLFKAKDATETNIGNRLYADTQEYAYPAATALPFGFRRQNYRGLPGFLGAPKSTTQHPFERAPEDVGPVASGAVGCGKCGGGANDPALRAGIKNIDLARLFPGAKVKCSSCEQVQSQLPTPPIAVVVPKPLPIKPGRVIPKLPDPEKVPPPRVELPRTPPRVEVRVPRTPSKKRREAEASREDNTRVVDLIAANKPLTVVRPATTALNRYGLGRKDRGTVK